jgi:hypothetical protein
MSLIETMPAWLSLCGAALGGGGVGAGLRPVLEYWKGRRAQTDEVAMGLVEKLQARIERLEEGQAAERQLCDAKLSVLRHELRNVQGNFDALLLAIEVAPEKAAEVVAKVKARRGAGKMTGA